ncbi:NLRP3 protein, partial [Amia calva]|nr:NLRP3 protein [Amia calva]
MSTTVENLFNLDECAKIQRTVILQGQAGIGKSFTVQKIMSDWASGKHYCKQFEYVFHLKCQQLNLIRKQVSVVDLILSNSEDLKPVILEILSQPEKILFIIDGFDEIKFSLHIGEDSLCPNPHQQSSLEVTLSSLIRKVVLSKSFLLITTRSTALEKLKKVLKQPRYTEILGFSEKGIKEYFQKFFKDEHQAMRAFTYIKENDIVYTACFIPVVCWIVCTVLMQQFEEGTNITHVLNTKTTIFIYFVYTLHEYHSKDVRLPVQDILKQLGILAENGVKEQQVLFAEKQVKEIFMDSCHFPSCFLNKILLKKGIFNQTVYSFMHLSFQEFFAAFSYVLCQDEEAKRKVTELLKDSQDYSKRHLLSTVQFLFGLSNDETRQFMEEKYNHCISSEIRSQLKEWIQKVGSTYKPGSDLLTILYCLYEFQDCDFVRSAMENFRAIFLQTFPLKRTDCAVLSYCLQASRGIKILDLSNCNLNLEELEILLPELHKCINLRLWKTGLTEACVNDLCLALKKGQSVTQLYLDGNGFTDASIPGLLSLIQKCDKLDRFR